MMQQNAHAVRMKERQTAMTPDNGPIRTFASFLALVEDGRLADELTSELEDLVAEMQDSAGGNTPTKGKITIALNLGFDPKSGMFEVSGDFKVVKPKTPRGRSIFWATAENLLTRFNPRQQDMFMRDVTGDRGSARDA